jgi:hypothetical protein
MIMAEIAMIAVDATEAALIKWAIVRMLGAVDCPIGRQHPWWDKLDGVHDRLVEAFEESNV